MSVLIFTVPGKPIPQERAYMGKFGAFDRPRSRAAKKVIAQAALSAMAQQGFRKTPLSVKLTAIFYGARPNADLSNLLKLIEDGMNNVVYNDDKQICELDIRREPAAIHEPGTFIKIQEL